MNEIKVSGSFKEKQGEVTLRYDGVDFKNSSHEFHWDEFSFHIVIDDSEITLQNLTNDNEVIKITRTATVVEFIKSSELSYSDEKVSRSGIREYKKVFTYFAVFFFIVFGTFQSIRFLSSKFVKVGSPSEEIEWSKGLVDDYLLENVLPESDQRVKELRSLSTILLDKIDTNPFEVNLYIMEDETANAFAYPGGHIVFTTGFLKNAKTPEEVLGVLAHELAHVKLRHSFRRMEQEKYVNILKTFLLADSMFTSAGDFLSSVSFSRVDESEADELALQYLSKAKISATGIIDFFERKDRVELKWISTHPLSKDRVKNFRRHVNNEPEFASVDFDLDSLQ